MTTAAHDLDDPFAHLGSDFDGVAVPTNKNADTGLGTFPETCSKCRGTGRFRSYAGRDCGPCHACNGRGRKTFKTSATDRSRAREQAADRTARNTVANWESFQVAHPVVAAWILESAPRFEFAADMLKTVGKFGSLTEKQLAACERSVAKLAAAREAATTRTATAREIDATQIEAAFGKASESLKSPKLRLAGFIITRAKATSANAGALYVKSADAYLGKIMSGKFFPSRECTAEHESTFRTVAADPKAAAVAFGRLTGSCACCGRELSRADSIALGIGPICASKFGW